MLISFLACISIPNMKVIYLRNVGILSLGYITCYPRRYNSSYLIWRTRQPLPDELKHCDSGVTNDLKEKLLNTCKDSANNKNQDLHLCNLIGVRGILGQRMEVKYPRKVDPLTWYDMVRHWKLCVCSGCKQTGALPDPRDRHENWCNEIPER
jgi:hypothetical protein